MDTNMKNFKQNDVAQTVELINWLMANPKEIETLNKDLKKSLYKATGLFSTPKTASCVKAHRKQRKAKRKAVKTQLKKEDKIAVQNTGIRQARAKSVFVAPQQISESQSLSMPKLAYAKSCYVCKTSYKQLHHFYDGMCVSCGNLNYAKRFQTANLSNQVALVTGARVKIGFQIALMLLRSGAKVIATTRFPVDAALRFSKEKDFSQWQNNLSIHGLDLRHIPSVELFCNYVENNFKQLDILINNAAQTIRKPAGFYKHLLKNELQTFSSLPSTIRPLLKLHFKLVGEISNENAVISTQNTERQKGIGILNSALLTQNKYGIDEHVLENDVFPLGQLDKDLQQVDLRKNNSWNTALGDVEPLEMVEAQLVNAIAPFVLCNRLIHLMRKHKTFKKHIINVSAMEGKFTDKYKGGMHPHTNMAKAGLNMLTRTSAQEFAKEGIYMNAVDTGWVTNENPIQIAEKMKSVYDFEPPLDIVDGAARVLDPLFCGINSGNHEYGQFLKDYASTSW